MPKKLSTKLRSRAKAARRSIEVNSRDMAERMRKHAIDLTSGGIPEDVIRKNRPWARYGPNIGVVVKTRARPNSRKKVRYTAGGEFPLNPINKHSGRLQQSLRVIRVKNGYRLLFTAPYSKYVLRTGGTKSMVDREFWKQMQRFAAYERKRASNQIKRDLRRQ